MLSPRCTKCMSALVWLLHTQETFCCDIFFSFFFSFAPDVLINLTFATTENFSLFQFSEEKKKYVRLFASSLLLCPLLSCVCFVLQCAPVHRKIPWLLKVRLLYRSTKSKCMFPFVWHEQRTSPDSRTAHSHTNMHTKVHQRQKHSLLLLSGWKVTVCLSRPRKDEG